MTSILARDVEVDGRRVDVRLDQRSITAVEPSLSPAAHDEVIDGRGGALLPGFWDHHVHLLSAAAARRSVHVGPDRIRGLEQMGAALRAAPATPSGWIRAVGHHESAAGPLDRHVLDQMGLDRPVRVQHRSGRLWILDSRAVDLLDLDAIDDAAVERAADGRLTGRVFGGDDLLRDRLPDDPPDLAGLGATLAASGVVGVTDATPATDVGGWDLLARACATADLPQHVWVTGAPSLGDVTPPSPLHRGPVKIYLADHDLPPFDSVSDAIGTARASGRAVAFHSVTSASLVLALTALDDHPPHRGDRIEHGAVIPTELVSVLAMRDITVVIQPGFVAERGDQYLDDVEADDMPHLHRCRSLLEAGVGVAGSTDLPFSDPDPWAAIAAATTRRTPSGRTLGADEVVDPVAALALYLGSPDAPGGSPRRVAPGQPADLCLLDRPLAEQLAAPTSDAVVRTIIGGTVVHEAHR